MEMATRPVLDGAESAEALRAVPKPQSLRAVAYYALTEVGRKASLLAGGNGRAQQKVIVDVPVTRLHLVSVNEAGEARLKLQPRFERADDQTVVRRDGILKFDTPPTIEDLFREAARNYELEPLFRGERQASKNRRIEANLQRRREIAEEFFANPRQRAMAYPQPTPKRCFLATSRGKFQFDEATDVGPARDVPREAYRRFRSDQRARRAHGLNRRAETLALHEEKTRVIAAWIADHGSVDQRERYAAGVLPVEEVIEALTDDAFSAVAHVPRYAHDGAERLQEHLRRLTGQSSITVAPADLQVLGVHAEVAAAAQWTVVHELQSRLPDADVKVRAHRLSWRRDPRLPALTVHGVLATRRCGPFVLRREFAVPER